jgi:hypothetical protein
MLNALLGNASEINLKQLQSELGDVLIEGEIIQSGYKVLRDLFIFTDKRLILIDKQGFTGKKVEYNSVPYKSIIRFAVETVGHFDDDSELKIWLAGGLEPISREFKKNTDIIGLQRTLARYILK